MFAVQREAQNPLKSMLTCTMLGYSKCIYVCECIPPGNGEVVTR